MAIIHWIARLFGEELKRQVVDSHKEIKLDCTFFYIIIIIIIYIDR